MTAYATVDDVAASWRPLTAAEKIVAESDLEYASEIVRQQVLNVDDRITAGSLSAVLVNGVVRQMVLRKLKNPDGFRSVQEAIEDYSRTKTIDATLSTGAIYLSDDERRLLSRRSAGAFSVTPSQEPTTYAMLEQIAANRAGRCL